MEGARPDLEIVLGSEAMFVVKEIPERTPEEICISVLEGRYCRSEGKKVIELGVGPGSLIPYLQRKFGEKVCRMDLGDWFIRNNKLEKQLVKGDPQNLPIASNSVDVVISAHTFRHLPDLKRTLEEVERVLIPGGEVVIVVSRPRNKKKRLGNLLNFLGNFGDKKKLRDAWREVEAEKADRIWERLELTSAEDQTEARLEMDDVKMMCLSDEKGHCWIVTMKKKG